MRKLRLVIFCVVMAPLLTCSATSYFFRTVDVRDGLSDNHVRDVMRDSHGYIWISTINGLSRYDGYRLKNFMPHQHGGSGNDVQFVRETADSTLWMVSVRELYTFDWHSGNWQKDGSAHLSKLGVKGTMKLFYVDEHKNLWVSTDKGLYHYDYAQHRLYSISNLIKSPILHMVSKDGTTIVVTSDYNIYEVSMKGMRLIPLGQATMMPYSRDSRVYLDNYQNLWLYQSHSLAGSQWLFSLKTHQWRQLTELKQMGNVFVNAIAEDLDGNVWVGTGNTGIRLFAYDRGESRLTEKKSLNAFSTLNSHITCLYLDDNSTMWVGSAKLGVSFTNLCSPTLNVVSTGEYEDVSSLLHDRNGNLWIGFDGGGVMRKTPSGMETHFSALRQQIPSDIVTSLTLHTDGSVLVGTYGEGIARFDGTRFVSLYPAYPQLKYVKSMTTDSRGCLWVATVDKGVVMVKPDGKIVHYTSKNSSLVSDGIMCLTIDSLRNILYIGTSLGVSVYDIAKESFLQVDQLEKLKGAYVSSLMMCDRNMLWIGSRNGLWVYCAKDDTMECLTTDDGMSNNTIRALAESNGRVWASTDNGLTCISPQHGQDNGISFKCYPFYDSRTLQNIIFSNNASLTTADGTVLLGSFTGYVSIQPEELITHYPEFHLEFTEFWVNENTEEKSPTGLTIHYNDRLGITVSAMVPSISHKVKYLYRFKGDKEWVHAPGNTLHFVSLSPGTHILQVKAEIPGMMESDVAELTIKVRPPFWRSLPAILLYLLLLTALGYLIYRAIRNRQQRELAIKQMGMNLKRYEMEEEKIEFFTNISHDLKTPMTLVVAPLEKLRQADVPATIQTDLDMAWRNARQLYDLILQLLDFSRLDTGKEKLHLKHGDIVSFVRETAQGFTYYAIRKQIQLHLDIPSTSMECYFDESKMRRIITNLLSNAYKYNTDNGSVTVTLDVDDGDGKRQMTLRVADTGIGIQNKHNIFNRFVQESSRHEQEGNGLGLYIVKTYVELMGGSISVSDNKPVGSIFTVTMPVIESCDTEEVMSLTDEPITADTPEAMEDDLSKPVILVVDDNADIRLFLQRSLGDEYVVLVASNGKEALQVMKTASNVSLVVSDVMMPEMDGIELFRHLKSDINYSHIPVILLTAKSREENIVAGLEEGAADYITKPFSLPVLRLRIRVVLEWSQNVHRQVAHGIEIKPSEITVSSLDEELISNVISDIEEHINDMNYSVSQLSSAVGMTRGHLYKKLMAITGKPPLEFIRIIKLKRGKSLLDQGKTNISEVADMVGFSAKQFTHYFKMMYDATPSEYLRKRKNNT